MTRLRKRPRLTLEPLEARDCPTLDIVYVGGNLLILGRPDALAINSPTDGLNIQVTSASGAVTVSEIENGVTIKSYGTYVVRKNLYVGLTNYNTDINVDLNGQRLYANVILNLGLGDYSPFGALPTGTPNPINIYDSTNSGTGSVAGNITAFNGSGIETLSIGANAFLPLVAPYTNGIEVDGDVNVNFSNRIDGNNLSTGDILYISGATTVRGNVTTTGVDNVIVGEEDSNDGTNIQGNLSVSDAGAYNELDTEVYGTVGGNIAVQGTDATAKALPETLKIGSTTTTTLVGGSVTADLTASVNNVFDLAAGSTIQGPVSYTGAGLSAVNLNGSVLGDTSLSLSDADNMVRVRSTAYFAGNLVVTAGNGNNDLPTFDPTIDGNLTLDLGAGDNSFTFTGIMNFGTLTTDAGNGDNSISLGGSGMYALSAHLGAGANTVTYDASVLSKGDIEFAPHVAADSLTSTGVIHGPFTLVNYP